MATCPHCERGLKNGNLFLDDRGRPVDDWRKAAWKTCPRCSELEPKVHVFLRFPQAWGGTGTREMDSGRIPQSDCSFHRATRNKGKPNPESERRVCSKNGIIAPSEKAGPNPSVARPPVVRAKPRESVVEQAAPARTWSDEELDGLVRDLVQMAVDDLEGKRDLRQHVRIERSSEIRNRFLEQRRREERLNCEVCLLDFAEEYGQPFAEVLEVHHLHPLWKGPRVSTVDELALLCPSCHRAVHFHRREPLTLDDLRKTRAYERR